MNRQTLFPNDVTAHRMGRAPFVTIVANGYEDGITKIRIEASLATIYPPIYMVTGEPDAVIGMFPYTVQLTVPYSSDLDYINFQMADGTQKIKINQNNVAVYAEGYMYPDLTSKRQPVEKTIAQLQKSGFTTAMLCQFHIDDQGDIIFNDPTVVSKGKYIGDQTWPSLINGIIGNGSTVTRIGASIGPNFENIFTIYNKNSRSFEGTYLQSNFTELHKQFPSISFIDLDCEDDYSQPGAFVAFCNMLIEIGFSITFCPYNQGEITFWLYALQSVENSYPGKVLWWNLQCYSGGVGNRNPATFDLWAAAITTAIPGFQTDGFIVAGDSTNDTPSEVQTLMTSLSKSNSFGGGFIWTFDHIIEANPDPTPQEQAYANAIAAL